MAMTYLTSTVEDFVIVQATFAGAEDGSYEVPTGARAVWLQGKTARIDMSLEASSVTTRGLWSIQATDVANVHPTPLYFPGRSLAGMTLYFTSAAAAVLQIIVQTGSGS